MFLLVFIYMLISTFQTVLANNSPNQALFDYVTIQIRKQEDRYITMLPKAISHNFNVSFVFPNMAWNTAFSFPEDDEFYCFTNKLRRRLQQEYYKDDNEYIDSSIVEYRNGSVIADFNLQFKTSVLWPAWNVSSVQALFPDQLKGLAELFPFPQINASRNPYVNYTAYEITWFEKIKDGKHMFGEQGAFAYYGYYNITPPSPTYDGPVYFSPLNLIFYGFIGFNIFVVIAALCFWLINCQRDKLLLSYWFKEELPKSEKERAPGDF